jgi:type I restriction enzyme S subunit
MLDAYNGLLLEAIRAIALLQERRTALISAAVTGKIDVRSFAPQIPEVA